MKPSLDGVIARMARAQEHLDNLNLVLEEFGRTHQAQGALKEHQAEERAISAVIDNLPELPIQVRLMIGEVVHSLACALDNIVFQLSLSHQIATGNPDAFRACDEWKTYFPIFKTSTKHDLMTIKKRLCLMAPAPAQLIRDMQPYKRRPLEPTREPLWVLRQLDVIDKHRVVLALAHAAYLRHITITAPGEEPEVIDVAAEAGWQRLEKDAELFRFTLPPNAGLKPGTQLKATIARRILFAETQLCDGDNVLHTLKNLIPWVQREVINVLAPFVV